MAEYKNSYQLPPGTLFEFDGPIWVDNAQYSETEITEAFSPFGNPDFWHKTNVSILNKRLTITLPVERVDICQMDDGSCRVRVYQRAETAQPGVS